MDFWEKVDILFNRFAWAQKKKKKKREREKGCMMKDVYPVKCKEHQERIHWWGNVFLMWEQNDKQSIAQKEEASKYIPGKERKK